MDVLVASFVSYWVGWWVYRYTYTVRLRLQAAAFQAAMDQAYDRLVSDEDKMSFLMFCSNVKVVDEARTSEGALRVVAESILEQRGLSGELTC